MTSDAICLEVLLAPEGDDILAVEWDSPEAETANEVMSVSVREGVAAGSNGVFLIGDEGFEYVLSNERSAQDSERAIGGDFALGGGVVVRVDFNADSDSILPLDGRRNCSYQCRQAEDGGEGTG